MNTGPLAPEIGQRYQISCLALLAFGKNHFFHEVHLPAGFEFSTVYNKRQPLAIALLIQGLVAFPATDTAAMSFAIQKVDSSSKASPFLRFSPSPMRAPAIQ